VGFYVLRIGKIIKKKKYDESGIGNVITSLNEKN
jgi:hypothetical protein